VSICRCNGLPYIITTSNIINIIIIIIIISIIAAIGRRVTVCEMSAGGGVSAGEGAKSSVKMQNLQSQSWYNLS